MTVRVHDPRIAARSDGAYPGSVAHVFAVGVDWLQTMPSRGKKNVWRSTIVLRVTLLWPPAMTCTVALANRCSVV